MLTCPLLEAERSFEPAEGEMPGSWPDRIHPGEFPSSISQPEFTETRETMTELTEDLGG